ncbi:hypothetical protein OsI_26702 [Oryza sativa Indica Group]|uniref:Uncharacterized protein n=1 Tax=Oryza sativa subsp. indica TaxID=39946 RepID=B8B813_ORYSI|nr:hypothetical protein OsI_26702 [Oryza sativa Indica Group]
MTTRRSSVLHWLQRAPRLPAADTLHRGLPPTELTSPRAPRSAPPYRRHTPPRPALAGAVDLYVMKPISAAPHSRLPREYAFRLVSPSRHGPVVLPSNGTLPRLQWCRRCKVHSLPTPRTRFSRTCAILSFAGGSYLTCVARSIRVNHLLASAYFNRQRRMLYIIIVCKDSSLKLDHDFQLAAVNCIVSHVHYKILKAKNGNMLVTKNAGKTCRLSKQIHQEDTMASDVVYYALKRLLAS